MKLQAITPAAYLVGDDVTDLSHPSIRQLAATLRAGRADDLSFAQAAFEHVRDGVRHSWDAQDPRVTLSASETLREGVGLCFRAKLGERDYPEVLVSPHPEVVRVLRDATDVLALCRTDLPSHL